MDSKLSDKEWDDLVRGVNVPPEVPRERMWQVIDAARQDRRRVVTAPGLSGRRRPVEFWRFAAGLAAVLVIGFALGRFSGGTNAPSAVPGAAPAAVASGDQPRPTTNDPRLEREVYRLAAASLFGRADYLLTDFKVRSCAEEDLAAAPALASGMLVQTRLLLDSPAARDPGLREMLEDLELVLAQIGGLSRDNCARDVAWIRQGLRERSTLDRLRMMSAGGAQGSL